MANETKKLQLQGEQFDGEKLHKCLLHCLMGLSNMHAEGKVHGNLSPVYIGQRKENEDYLIIDDLRS